MASSEEEKSINASIEKRLNLLEEENLKLKKERNLYREIAGINTDIGGILGKRYGSEKDILNTVRNSTNILKDQSKYIKFQQAEKSRIQSITSQILSISEDSYSLTQDQLGTEQNITKIQQKRETLAKKIIELQSLIGVVQFKSAELQKEFNDELKIAIEEANKLDQNLSKIEGTSKKIQGSGLTRWFEGLEETSNKIGLGKFTDVFKEAAKASRETATSNQLSKEITEEIAGIDEKTIKNKKEQKSLQNEYNKITQESSTTGIQEFERIKEVTEALKKQKSEQQGISQLTEEELKTGKGLTEERLKQLGLKDITKGNTGTSAKELIKQFQSQSKAKKESLNLELEGLKETKKSRLERSKGIKDKLKENKLNSENLKLNKKGLSNQLKGLKTGKAGMMGIKAGAKALGPILKKALGPLGLILMVKDVLIFMKDAVFAASKRTAEFQKNLGLGRDRSKELSNELRKTAASARQFADTINEGDDNISRLGGRISRVQLSAKSISKSFSELNQNLGTTLDIFKDLGDEGRQLLTTTTLFRDNLGLSSQAIAELQKEQIRTGKNQEEVVKQVLGEVTARNLINKTAIDAQLVLEDIFKLSEKTKAMFGFQTVEIAKAVYEARKLGFSLDSLDSTASSLLDFESSIAKELEAELILGKDLNLEKARQFALNNDLVGVANELRKQNVDIVELQQENRIAAEAYAAAVGTPLDTLVKQEKSLRETEGIQKRLNALGKDNLEIQTDKGKVVINAQKLQEMGLQDINALIKDINLTEEQLSKILGEQVYQNKLAEDAQTKFNKALEMAKEQFAYFVSSGVLEDVVNTLADFTAGLSESWIFDQVAGDEVERLTRRTARQLEKKEKSLQKENEELTKVIKSLKDKEKHSSLTEEEKKKLDRSQTQQGKIQSEIKIILEKNTNLEGVKNEASNKINEKKDQQANLEGFALSGPFGGLAGLLWAEYRKLTLKGEELDNNTRKKLEDAVKDAEQTIAANPYSVKTTKDAIIRPNEKQIIVPDKQDVIATFKPGGVIDKTLSTDASLDTVVNKPTILTSTTVVDNSELVKEISKLREDLAKTNSKPIQVESIINLDGNRMGTALGMASYRTQ